MDCASCDKSFLNVGQHYRQSSCEYPTPTEHQMEIIEGVLMGDGCIFDDGHERLKFVVEMVNGKFLNWLSTELNDIVTSVVHNEIKGTYTLRTIRCPTFTEMYNKWYPNGEKQYPRNLDMTPRKFKMWYVTDGHLRKTSGRPNITIGCSNEFHRKEYLSSLIPFANPSFYSDGMWLSADETEQAFEYMGSDPVAGFERKWVNNSE